LYGGGIYNLDSNPVITNSIFWGNYAYLSGNQIYNDTSTATFNFCDIEGGLNVEPGCGGDDSLGSNNINADPDFFDTDANNFHLGLNSGCIDMGTNTLSGITLPQTDIDGENRKIDGDKNGSITADVGADEFYWSPTDVSGDGITNFLDYAIFANTWLIQSGQPNYNDNCDFENNNVVDINDLILFCSEWLWEGGWLSGWMNQMESELMMIQQEQFDYQKIYLTLLASKSVELKGEISVQKESTVTEEDIKMTIEWFQELWLNGDLDKLTEEQFLEFLKLIENSLL
jgi:hypothetical protein